MQRNHKNAQASMGCSVDNKNDAQIKNRRGKGRDTAANCKEGVGEIASNPSATSCGAVRELQRIAATRSELRWLAARVKNHDKSQCIKQQRTATQREQHQAAANCSATRTATNSNEQQRNEPEKPSKHSVYLRNKAETTS